MYQTLLQHKSNFDFLLVTINLKCFTYFFISFKK